MTTGQQIREPKVFNVRSRQLKMNKEIDWLARTDVIGGMVHLLDEGGENNLHSHTASDAFWIVLEGEATFYGDGDSVIAELGPGGTVLIPRGTKYWFKKSGQDQAVVMRIWANAPNIKDERVEFAPPSETIQALLKQGAERQ
jgi:mannose-6-phosphate isomerase-like protein (cupin superfamily)